MAASTPGPLNLQVLLRVLALRPQLLAEHGAAYAEMLADDLQLAADGWRQRALLQALGLCGIVVALMLAGVAALFWAAEPEGTLRLPWMFWAVPLLPALLAVACQWALNRHPQRASFSDLRRQLSADLEMLREAGVA